MLDKDGNTIELKNDDDDDFQNSIRDDSVYTSDDSEIAASGYTIEDAEEALDGADSEEGGFFAGFGDDEGGEFGADYDDSMEEEDE